MPVISAGRKPQGEKFSLTLGSMNEKATSNEATEVYARAGKTTPQAITPEETVVLDAATEQFPASMQNYPATSNYQTTDYQTTEYQAADYQPADYSVDDDYDYPEAEPVSVPDPEPPVSDKRGTLNFGLLIIRLVMGLYLTTTAIATFFQLGTNEGIVGLQADYQTYAYPQLLAIVVPVLQLAAGVFLIIGLLTPVAAALATIVTIFAALHSIDVAESISLVSLSDSVWLGVIIAGIALSLQFTGPGKYCLDFGRSWTKRPLASSWVFAIVGIAGAVALWWFGAGVNPLS